MSEQNNCCPEATMSTENCCTGTYVTESPPCPLSTFPTGASYDGAVDIMGMTGYGEYTYPNGVVYRGFFEDGLFHGSGELVYKTGPDDEAIVSGEWVQGVLTERKVYFNGSLEYQKHKWMYCKLPDRRYEVEFETDLQPAGQCHLTPDEPPREIPPGMYDTGDGFYDPITKVVYDYEHKLDVIRAPSLREQKWIEDNCRKAPVGSIGPRPDHYEIWSAPIVEPTPLPNPTVPFKPKFTYQKSVFEQDNAELPLFYNPDTLSVPQRHFQSEQDLRF